MLREITRVLQPGGKLVVTVPTLPGYPPHRVLARLIRFVPERRLLCGKADEKGRTLEGASGEQDGSVVLARADTEQILAAFGHYRHYDESSLRDVIEAAGLKLIRMRRFQMLFESEMIYFWLSVRGLQHPLFYPLMRAISALDYILPSSYPGVGLMAVCTRA